LKIKGKRAGSKPIPLSGNGYVMPKVSVRPNLATITAWRFTDTMAGKYRLLAIFHRDEWRGKWLLPAAASTGTSGGQITACSIYSNLD